jgi:hypothetical protein
MGGNIQLVTTKNNYLQISGIQVFGWSGIKEESGTAIGGSSGTT